MPVETRQSEGEPRRVQGLEISTAAFLHNPKQLFRIVHELNDGRAETEQYGIELYPMRRTLDLPVVGRVEGVTVEKVRSWQDQFPLAQVNRIHLPFSHNRRDALQRAFGHTQESPQRRALRIADLIVGTGAATSNRGFVLAEELARDQEKPVSVHGHTNVVAGYHNEGKLGDLRERLREVNVYPFLAENEHAFRTNILPPDRISNPFTIRDDVINRYQLDGMLLGLDHLATEGKTIEEMRTILDGTKDVVRAVHIAGPEHAPLDFEREETAQLLEALSETDFVNPVSIVLDYNPKSMKGSSYDQQLDKVHEAFQQIERSLKR